MTLSFNFHIHLFFSTIYCIGHMHTNIYTVHKGLCAYQCSLVLTVTHRRRSLLDSPYRSDLHGNQLPARRSTPLISLDLWLCLSCVKVLRSLKSTAHVCICVCHSQYVGLIPESTHIWRYRWRNIPIRPDANPKKHRQKWSPDVNPQRPRVIPAMTKHNSKQLKMLRKFSASLRKSFSYSHLDERNCH